jgi:Ca-activated chloride channel family protein
VFCIGVGNEVNRPLLTQLADSAGGLAAFLSSEDHLKRQASAFRQKLLRPAATSVRLSFAGVDVYDVEPQQLPNLYFGAPVRVYGRYRASGKATIKLEADVLGSPLVQTIETSLPAQDGRNPEIERMWAYKRVERLMAAQRESGAASAGRDEIVRLCEGYSIVSEYASFIVLENDGEYRRWAIERRNATRVARDRRAQLALRKQLDQLRDSALAQLGPASKDASPGVVQANSPAFTSFTPPASTPADSAPPTSPSFASPPVSGDGGGGGAIDPVTAAIALALAGASAAAARRSRRKSSHESARP